MIYSFEEFLSDKCDTHTNNDPVGFEKWLEELDGEDYMKYAQEYGNYVAYETASDISDKITTITLKLHDNK